MKKSYLIYALGGLMLASCANDDIVNPNEGGKDLSNGAPMTFSFTRANMGRAGDAKLETESFDFGVWALKTKEASNSDLYVASAGLDDATNLVMNHYLVGYKGKDDGYFTAVSKLLYGSRWFYEGLGNAEYADRLPYAGETTSRSVNANQFLKYWDGSYTNTFFFGYAPYTDGTWTPEIEPADADGVKMTFPVMATAADVSVMYGATKTLNSEYIGVEKTVPMRFHRLRSQLQIAFYEDIDGYDVEMGKVTYAGGTTTIGAPALPYTAEGDVYSAGKYVTKGYPVVVYPKANCEGATGEIPALVTFSAPATGEYYESTPLEFSTDGLTPVKPNNGTAVEFIGTDPTTKVYSPTIYNVIPNTGTEFGTDKANAGLQFIFEFTLHSKDTKETITVKNARVNVPATYTSWAPNTVYTYVFKITKNTSGHTGTTDPGVDPEKPEEQALWPIVFKEITIAAEGEDEHEFVVND